MVKEFLLFAELEELRYAVDQKYERLLNMFDSFKRYFEKRGNYSKKQKATIENVYKKFQVKKKLRDWGH